MTIARRRSDERLSMCVLGSLAWLLVSGCAAFTSMCSCTETPAAAVRAPGRLDEPLGDPRDELARLRLIAAGADPVTAHAALERILEWHRIALRAAGRSTAAHEGALGRLREDERRLLSPERGVEAVMPLGVAALDPALYEREPEATRAALAAWLTERERHMREPGGLEPPVDARTLAALGPFFESLPIDLYAQLYAMYVVTDDARFDSAAVSALTIRDRHVLFAVAERRLGAGDRGGARHIASRLIERDTGDLDARILRVALAHSGDGPLPPNAASRFGYEAPALMRVALDLQASRLAPEAQPSERLALAVKLMTSRRPDAAFTVLDAIADRGDDANAVREFVRRWVDPTAERHDVLKRACSLAERDAVYFGPARCRVTPGASAAEAPAPEATSPLPRGEDQLANATLARIERLLADGELVAAEAMLAREGVALPMVARVGTWLALRDARDHVVAVASADPWAWEQADLMRQYPPVPNAARLANDLWDALALPPWERGTPVDHAPRPQSSSVPNARASRYDQALRASGAADPATLIDLAEQLPAEEAAFVTTQALLAAVNRGDRRLARTLAERLSALRSTSVYPLLGRLAVAMLDDASASTAVARRALARVLPGGFGAVYEEPFPSPSAPVVAAPPPAARCDEATLSQTGTRLHSLVRRGRYDEGVAVLRQALDVPCGARVLDDVPLLRAMLPELGDAALVLTYWHPELDWTFVSRDDVPEAWRAIALEDFRAGRLDRLTAADIVDALTATDSYEVRALRARFPKSHALTLGALALAADEPDFVHGGSAACGPASGCRALALRLLARDADDPANVAYAARVLAALGDADDACRRLAQALAAHAEDPVLLETQANVCDDQAGVATTPR